MQKFGQYIYLVVLLFTVLLAFAFTHADQEPFLVPKKETPMPSLENRTAAVLLVMYDLGTSNLVNTTDVNVVYKLWSSQMVKRGLPDHYINPELFEALKGNLSPPNVMKLLREYYDVELEERELRSDRKAYKVRGVCSN